MICLAVTHIVRPGMEESTVEHLRRLTEATRLEPGCRFYQAHRSPAESRKFFLYEQYDDQAALDFHRGSPHFEEHVKGGLMALAESRHPEIYSPLTD